MERESKIEEWLNSQIKKLGCKSYKFVSPGNPGVPDRIYLLPGGKVYFVELKRIIGKLSGVQMWQREQFLQMGATFKTVYGMEQAKDLVKEIKDEIQTVPLSETHNQ
jgi:hypothetical protein